MAKKKIHLVAEGDSWFAFPGISMSSGNVLSSFQEIQINKKKKGNIKCVLAGIVPLGSGYGFKPPKHRAPANGSGYAYQGHTIKKMVDDEEKRGLLAVQIEREDVTGMIFSAGGNDLMNKMPSFLNNNDGSNNYFNKDKLNKVLKDIEEGYKYFIDLCVLHEAKLITHTYCPADPTKGGVKILFADKGPGPWIKPVLKRRGYTKIKIQKAICVEVSKRFKAMLDGLKEDYVNTFDYVDLLGIRDLDGKRSDEIHLTKPGYKIVAKKFEKKLNDIFKVNN